MPRRFSEVELGRRLLGGSSQSAARAFNHVWSGQITYRGECNRFNIWHACFWCVPQFEWTYSNIKLPSILIIHEDTTAAKMEDFVETHRCKHRVILRSCAPQVLHVLSRLLQYTCVYIFEWNWVCTSSRDAHEENALSSFPCACIEWVSEISHGIERRG